MEERIQKLMAQAGIASRREAEGMIVQGRVTVNGQRANLGDKADPAVDDIRVDGARLHLENERVYIMLNKPMGVVTTVRAQEQERRRTVRDLVPIKGHLYPVGRLDADSEGLVLLTNDGELAEKLTHPRYEHPKVYEVALQGNVPDEALDIWRRGVMLDDGLTKPVDIKLLLRDRDLTWIRITMREGRKRQIRRIATTLGYPVKRLIRTELDAIKLGALKAGEWRNLNESEVTALQRSAASTRRRSKPGTKIETRKPRSKADGARPVKTRRPAAKTGGTDLRSARRKTGRPARTTNKARAPKGSTRRPVRRPANRNAR
jgi:23S rRNA pseudouridine2605 synthase